MTIHRVLKIGSWIVDFLFVMKRYDEGAIVAILKDFNAAPSVIDRAREIMEANELNKAFTFANPEIKRALVVIGPTSSGDEWLDSFTHEIRHLADAIAKSIGYKLDSEPPAYLTGDTTKALAKTICDFGCNKLSWEDVDIILNLDSDYQHELWVHKRPMPDSDNYAKEIFKRFNEYKLINGK